MIGLALAGGGSHGTWQAAALSVLSRAGVRFDRVIGFSAGALNGAAYAQGLLDQAVERWKGLDRRTMRFSPRLGPLSLFSDSVLREAALTTGSDEEARARAKACLVVVSARIARDRPVYAEFDPAPGGRWDAPLQEHILASCAIPLVFPPVRLDFRGEEVVLIDGGVPCAEPVSFKALKGCSTVVALEMVADEEPEPPPWRPLRRRDWRGRQTVRRIMDQAEASLSALAQPPRVLRLRPSRRLPLLMLEFRPDLLKESIELGERDARAFLAAFDGEEARGLRKML